MGVLARSLERSAREAAAARQVRILRNATTDARRLMAADKTFKEGDIQVAVMIYVRLGLYDRRCPHDCRIRAVR